MKRTEYELTDRAKQSQRNLFEPKNQLNDFEALKLWKCSVRVLTRCRLAEEEVAGDTIVLPLHATTTQPNSSP